jgi:hypothetical protein
MPYLYTPATKTLDAIEKAMEDDQGAKFRNALKYFLPKMEDAYRGEADRHRSHFGFSNAADECARKLWYSFKWAKAKKFSARILSLFNRGHLEEARFLAMLAQAGFEVHFETPEGGQFKISDHNGHAGSALDAVVVGIPDLEPDTPVLVEMKTHGEKSFKDVVKKGVKESKPIHYGQMQIYMSKYQLQWGLYMAVNKNTDTLHLELIVLEPVMAERYIERAGMIIYTDKAPPRLSDSPAWYECKYCDFSKICHQKDVPEINCRTCIHSTPVADKKWHCGYYNTDLPKETQLIGCNAHLFNHELLNGAKVTKDFIDEGWYELLWKDRIITLGNDGDTQHTTSQELIDGNI